MEREKPRGPLYYADYIGLDRLLGSQQLQSAPHGRPAHDEMLFIIVHQTYELWFKQILHEVDRLQELFDAGDGARAGHTLKRIRTILKTLVGQVDILETMTPLEFLSFRERLESGSGFQSFQFRQFEFVLGAARLHRRGGLGLPDAAPRCLGP